MYLKRVAGNNQVTRTGRAESVVYHLHDADHSRVVSRSGDFDGIFQLRSYQDAKNALVNTSEFLVVTTDGFYLELRVVLPPNKELVLPEVIAL